MMLQQSPEILERSRKSKISKEEKFISSWIYFSFESFSFSGKEVIILTTLSYISDKIVLMIIEHNMWEMVLKTIQSYTNLIISEINTLAFTLIFLQIAANQILVFLRSV